MITEFLAFEDEYGQEYIINSATDLGWTGLAASTLYNTTKISADTETEILTETVTDAVDTLSSEISFSTIIENVLETYKTELSDQSNEIYQLFMVFNNIEDTTLNRDAIIEFFSGLYLETFTLDDIFEFLRISNLEITVENIWIFLRGYEDLQLKINSIRSKLFNKDYLEIGNIYAYLNDIYNAEITDNYDSVSNPRLFFSRKTLSDWEASFEWSKLILKPIIKYYGTNSYQNIMSAETDYWSILNAITDPSETYEMDISNDLLKKLKIGAETELIPFLMSKPIQKNKFSSISSTESFILSLFKKDYLNLSINEVYNFIDAMILELIIFIDGNYPDFDYYDYTEIPDLAEFVVNKMAELVVSYTDISAVSLIENKKIKFYLRLMAPFTRTENTDLTDISNAIDNELNLLSAHLSEYRAALLTQGKFKE